MVCTRELVQLWGSNMGVTLGTHSLLGGKYRCQRRETMDAAWVRARAMAGTSELLLGASMGQREREWGWGVPTGGLDDEWRASVPSEIAANLGACHGAGNFRLWITDVVRLAKRVLRRVFMTRGFLGYFLKRKKHTFASSNHYVFATSALKWVHPIKNAVERANRSGKCISRI
jgi:hypothetical protein